MGLCKCLMSSDIDVIYNSNIYCRTVSHGRERVFSSLKVVGVFHQRSKIATVKNRASNPSFSWGILNREIKLEKKGTNLVAWNSEVWRHLCEKVMVCVVAVQCFISLLSACFEELALRCAGFALFAVVQGCLHRMYLQTGDTATTAGDPWIQWREITA